MSEADVQNTKILMIDTSPAMLEVLKNFASKNTYDHDSYSDPTDACTALGERFQKFGADYRCVVLGWPSGDLTIMEGLIQQLSTPDHRDLPLLIICQNLTAEVKDLVRQRSKTKALLWKDYQAAAGVIDRLPVVQIQNSVKAAAKPVVKPAQKPVLNNNATPLKKGLLIDTAPSICHSLREIMEQHGYHVTVADNDSAARSAISTTKFDVVVTDYHLHGSEIEAFCSLVRSSNSQAVLAVVSSKYTDTIIKQTLSAGAATCLFKNESTELLFARIDALGNSMFQGVSDQATRKVVSSGEKVTESPANRKLSAKPKAQPKAQGVSEPAVPQPEVRQPMVLQKEAQIVKQSVEERPKPEKVPEKAVKQEVPVVKVVHGPAEKAVFLKTLAKAESDIANNQHGGIRYSVLMLDMQLIAATGDRLSIGDSEPMRKIVEQSLCRLYNKENSLAYLGDGQFALLLANRRVQDALMLTRKVLQVAPRMIRYLNNMNLVCHASVLQLQGKTDDPQILLQQSRLACLKTRRDKRDNCALVLPMAKYLTATETEMGKSSSTVSA